MCSRSNPAYTGPGGARDADPDTGPVDVSVDSPSDTSGVDSSVDAQSGADAGADVVVDAPPDGDDAGGPDSGVEASPDAGMEQPDAATDPADEAGPEASPEAPVDACPLPIAHAGPDQTMLHRTAAISLDGNRSAPDPLSYSWSIVDSQGLTFSATGGATASWSTTIIGSAPVNCRSGISPVFRLTVTNSCGSASDDVAVTVVNNAPAVTFAGATEVSPGLFEIEVPPGFRPSLRAVAADVDAPDVASLTYLWADLNNPPMTTGPFDAATLAFTSDTVAGQSYELTVAVSDCDKSASARLRVVVTPCLYASPASTCGGACTGAVGSPYRTIAEAVAAATPAVNVCLMSGNYDEAPVMKDGVDVYGGFDASGFPVATSRNTASTIRVNSQTGLLFGPGVTARLQYVSVQQALVVPAVGLSAAITVEGAAAHVRDAIVTGGRGSSTAAVRFTTSSAAPAGARPIVADSVLTGTSETSNATAAGLWVADLGTGGGVVDVQVTGCRISGGTPLSSGYGIIVDGAAARARIAGNTSISGSTGAASSRSVGVELRRTTGVTVADNALITGGGPSGVIAVGIRMDNTAGTIIERNAEIRGTDASHARIGILDGDFSPSAGFTEGRSTGMVIRRNLMVRAVGTGSELILGVGVALAGSQGALLEENEGTSPASAGGLQGGSSKSSAPTSDPIAPSCAGLYLFKARDTTVRKNLLRVGVYPCGSAAIACAAHDGTTRVAASGSQNTRWERNIFYVPPMDPRPDDAAALAMREARGAWAGGNIMAVAGAAIARGVYASSSEITLDGNLMHVDWDPVANPTPSNGSLRKYGIEIDQAPLGTVVIRNNIVLIRHDNPQDNYAETYAIRETVPAGGTATLQTRLHTFENNLLLAEWDDLTTDNAPVYYRLRDGSLVDNYPQNRINSLPGYAVGRNTNNEIASTRLTPLGSPTRAWTLRLRANSPAIDTGIAAPTNPLFDLDGEERPRGARIDKGADEY